MSDPLLTTLDDVSEFIVDCLHATAPTEDDGYPLIRTPNIGYGRFDLDGVQRVSQATYEAWTQRAVPQPGDLILAREAPAGNVAIVPDGQQVCLGQRTVHIRPDRAKVDPSFLCYFLLAPAQRGQLLAAETGATAKHINMRDIRRLPLAGLPPLLDQQRIGAFLADYDDLIDNNRRRIKLLEDSVRLLFDEWFVRLRFPGHELVAIVDGLPPGWTRGPLGASVVLRYGKALKAEDRSVDGEVPVYGSSGVVGTHEKAMVLGPAIIVGRKGNVGSVSWCTRDFWPIDTVYFVDAQTSDLYLYYALKNMHFISTDVAVPGLNRDFAYSRTLLSPLAELRARFLEVATSIHAQIDTLAAMNDKLRTARDLLLPRLMSGELTV